MINPENILFFDIETAGQYQAYENLDEKSKDLFTKRYHRRIASNFTYGESPESSYLLKSAISPTYGKVICVSFGTIRNNEYKIKSITGEEKDIIMQCYSTFENASKKQYTLCGFNIKNFDLPFLNRKFIKYGIRIPHLASVVGKKPWELNVFDLFDLFNANNEYPNLDEVCHEIGVNSPKQLLSGDKVHSAYYEGKIDLIQQYCEQDVRATMNIYKKIHDCL